MKVRNKSPGYHLIIVVISFSVLLIGLAQTVTIWIWQKGIISNITNSLSLLEVKPIEINSQLYWLAVVEDRLVLAPQAIALTADSPEVALKETFARLLAKSQDSKLTTTIPHKTRLLKLNVENDNIYVDLSQEFGQGGGSSSMIYRVAQVLYTATSINPQAKVFLSIEGQPLNEKYALGGEGLILEYPLTRTNFAEDFLTK